MIFISMSGKYKSYIFFDDSFILTYDVGALLSIILGSFLILYNLIRFNQVDGTEHKFI